MKKAHKDVVVNMNPDDAIEVDKTREPISMVFIGHVDAGKSTKPRYTWKNSAEDPGEG